MQAETERVDCVVVGAGVVGLAVARALALSGREVIVLEGQSAIGTATSSRNSEVIHAGIYYPPGSLKAELCVAGKLALYDYCAANGIPHKRLGKLIVASDKDQVPRLGELKARAEANGVGDLELLGRSAALRLEPALKVEEALLSPSTGTIDSHAYMLALQGDLEDAGGAIAFRTPMEGGELLSDGVVVRTGGVAPIRLKARLLVNAGGLTAHRIAASIDGIPPGSVPPVGFAKGNYFLLQGKSPFSRLIYPVPEPGGLGVHLTLDMGGQARFGPDVEWIDDFSDQPGREPDYRVDPQRSRPFYAAIRNYWPGLPDGALQPDYSGVRVKLDGAASPDFRIETAGRGAVINLFGFESPGLTASLAIGRRVAELAAAF
ncbi:NAD(P)/FAD-dependent oxidoreductase [Microbaculum marinum]|uniref:NAD(P)/FAD-dependent oxidoreductase n=1 Tax=Microbaculum marinum TaxID=1764581 RepID=A0AAW9RLV1_9HYPH